MNAKDVCEALSITRATLNGYIDQGLSYSGTKRTPTFSEEEVVEWLLVSGIAKPAQLIFDTVQQVADHYGEPFDTVKQWFSKQGCPGVTGCYIAEEIDDWLINEKRGKGENRSRKKKDDEDIDEGLSIQDELRLIKLESARGQLISLEEVKSEYIRQSTMIRSELGMIAAKVESRLPGDMDAELVTMIRDSIKVVVEECISIFSELDRDNWGPQ